MLGNWYITDVATIKESFRNAITEVCERGSRELNSRQPEQERVPLYS